MAEVTTREMIQAHKDAAAAAAKLPFAGSVFGDGWASYVELGSGRKKVAVEVGINEHPKSGGYSFMVGVDLWGFGPEKGRIAPEVERTELKTVAASFRRFGTDISTIGAQNGVARCWMVVPADKFRQAAKALPGIVKKFAQDLWDTRVSGMTEDKKMDYFDDHYSLDPRDPRYMSESELFAFAKKRDFQRTYGRFALQEGDEVLGEWDVFSHFDMLDEAQIVSNEPIQRAKDRMASALMRGGTTKMIKATSTRIKATTSKAKLMGIVKAIDQLIAEPGMDLNSSQQGALRELQKAAKLKASRMESRERIGAHMKRLREMFGLAEDVPKG